MREQIDFSDYKKLFTFPVLHAGWESDYTGWIMEHKETKKREVILTHHGTPYKSNAKELGVYLANYQRTIELTAEALEILEGR